ncbi:CDP-diacylglycerol--glycerol-3-phosphate 3-phosphatidyltransferase [Schaereria dolodes]|nr:CDP-diacylglycerol--glycerol-3-phosphate 3-phosphatidyltransferase [Schaereria dolodes]
MFVRRIAACSTRHLPPKRSIQRSICPRQFSSSGSEVVAPQSSNISVLSGIASELDRLAPRIDIRADQVKILYGPTEFYETLKTKIKRAEKRIYLSTLYIGKSEHELISCIRNALERSKKLKVSILTDALRGTRETPEPSCASLLSPLVVDFPDQVEVRMYHTPNLTGLRKRFIPRRINEGWGLQHMKLYGIDDEIILSGANLSSDYFSNRQDRYHVFSSKRVTNYFARVHQTMCSVSFLLVPNSPSDMYTLEWPKSNPLPSPLSDPQAYVNATTKLFVPIVSPITTSPLLNPLSSPSNRNTTFYPLLTLPRSISAELPALQSLLSTPLPPTSSYLFTAGYFNPHPSITASLLACSSATTSPSHPRGARGAILTASPWANGFYNSSGVSGMLPAAYTLLSRRFLKAARKAASSETNSEKQAGGIELREWRRGTVGTPGGWTYHAKGLWITLPSSPSRASSAMSPGLGPSITLLGSSNYTTRSYALDTEASAILLTSDPGLQKQLREEQEGLLKYSKVVREEDLEGGERRVGIGVRVALWIVRLVGGSL